MAYRFEQNAETGKDELVIDGWENGIAVSPYKGIGNIVGLSVKYQEGVAYVNYKRQACTMSGATLGVPVAATQSPSGLIYISDASSNVFKQDAVNGHTFTAIGSNPGTGAGGILWWNNYLLCFRTANTIDICGDGSGDGGILAANWNTAAGTTGVWPIDTASITLTAGISASDTTCTISTYTDAKGSARAFWNGPTGTYLASLGNTIGAANSQAVYATLTQGSASVAFTPAATTSYGSSMYVYPLQTGNLNGLHPAIVSRNDGQAYISHQNFIGQLGINSNYSVTSTAGNNFRKENFKSFFYNGVALALPNFEQVQSLDELVGDMEVAGNFNMYPWDRISARWKTPVPVQEGIYRVINILNNIYIFAGNKGNIYVYNGYSVSRFVKLPDYIAGVFDPTWQFGGVMVKRQRLWFQATASNTAGTVLWAGIYSVDLDTGALVEENPNSFGNGSSVTDYRGLLIDNSVARASVNSPGYSTNYDSYYSVWYNNSAGGMDYNDSTPYTTEIPFIETDIVPVGTAADQRTFTNAEFKLDRPLANGDSISLYVRSSLTGSYTLLGTTAATSDATTQVLSAFISPFTVEKIQWAQFKVTFICASSSSSRIPLREIRIR